MKTTGVGKQERKIESMAEIVMGIHPEMTRISVKGAFRLGINDALKNSGYASWKEVADKSLPEKRNFFNGLLESSVKHLLKIGFPQEKAQQAKTSLMQANDRFLKS